MERATFAGGCFWCTEAVFKRLTGVTLVTSGYAGDEGQEPTYKQVSSGRTNFVESVQIEFDPSQISFERLLDVFWATHDPTTLNQQGGDIGRQYASIIYFQNDTQKQIALDSLNKQPNAGKIVTKILPFKHFYEAESYHQNYYETYKYSNPYCAIVINPKIDKLISKFNSEVKDEYKQ